MNRTNIVLGFNLKDTHIEILNRYKEEFNYNVICIDTIYEINSINFFVAFIDLQNTDEDEKNSIIQEMLKYPEKRFMIINPINNTDVNNIHSVVNVFNNPERVRLEILKAYQKYMKIEKATKPYSNKLGRLIQMIRIFETGKKYSAESLTEFYCISKRTLLRDFELLKTIGVPIVYDKEKKVYMLRKSD